MALTGMRGKGANSALMMHALSNTPSLLLDCANRANAHAFFPHFPLEALDSVFVVPAESLYRFRDALLIAPSMASRLGVRSIVITKFGRLFDYSDERENNDVFRHSWELIKEMSRDMDVVVGVADNHQEFAQEFCDEVISWQTSP